VAINDYSTVANLVDMFPNIDLNGQSPSGTAYTHILGDLIHRASRALDRHTNRKPGAYKVDTDVTLYFDAPRGMGYLYYEQYGERMGGSYGDSHHLWIDELAAAPTTVKLSQNGQLTYSTTLATTDYILFPYNALDRGEPYIRIDLDLLNGTHSTWYGMKRGIEITGKFGYSTAVPADVEQAVLIQAGRWFKRAQQAWQDRISILDNALALTYLNKVDYDIAEMVAHYRRLAI
jgi:hypothetical protein